PRRLLVSLSAPTRFTLEGGAKGDPMDKISTCLWFNTEAEAAMKYYTSIFKKSKQGMVTRYGKHVPGREGQVMTAHFELEGRPFMALNGGPEFKFNESISLMVYCKDQK